MNIKQKLIRLSMALGIMLAVGPLTPMAVVRADTKCAGVETSIIGCDQAGGGKNAKDSGIWGILLLALNILTAGVGIAAVGGVVYAAILYTTASDRADQVKKAKDVLQNVAIGIAAYAGMYLLLNFLVPGGIFT